MLVLRSLIHSDHHKTSSFSSSPDHRFRSSREIYSTLRRPLQEILATLCETCCSLFLGPSKVCYLTALFKGQITYSTSILDQEFP